MIESKIKQTLAGFEVVAAEVRVMIFCTLKGGYRQLYSNILCSRVKLLFCLLVHLALGLCLFGGVCVC